MAGSVLIVDDSSAVRQALVRLFADGGFEVCGEAESGREAIEKAQGLNPGLIVMDLSMPGSIKGDVK
jgi:CheY-like chemotaxis protein